MAKAVTAGILICVGSLLIFDTDARQQKNTKRKAEPIDEGGIKDYPPLIKIIS